MRRNWTARRLTHAELRGYRADGSCTHFFCSIMSAHMGGRRMHVGFAGLGQMGIGMARNLIKAGHQVTVYNRTRSRAEELSAEGVKIADSPGALADAGIVITMLADDSAVEAVVFGGVLDRLPRGGLHVSMSTI